MVRLAHAEKQMPPFLGRPSRITGVSGDTEKGCFGKISNFQLFSPLCARSFSNPKHVFLHVQMFFSKRISYNKHFFPATKLTGSAELMRDSYCYRLIRVESLEAKPTATLSDNQFAVDRSNKL